MTDKAYLYGVLLGDGFLGKRYSKDTDYSFVMLKAIDKDFVHKFQMIVEAITGKTYSIYKAAEGKGNRKALWLCKCYAPELVSESVELTHGKTEIPNFVKDGTDEVKLAFIQGLMDSEGYVTFSINPLKQWHIGLYFANTSAWTKELWHMFQELGIEVSKFYRRKMKDGRKDCFSFKINILDYVDKGLSFNIKRKRERLEYVSTILRDYMRSYKNSYKECVDEIVRPVMKIAGVNQA